MDREIVEFKEYLKGKVKEKFLEYAAACPTLSQAPPELKEAMLRVHEADVEKRINSLMDVVIPALHNSRE